MRIIERCNNYNYCKYEKAVSLSTIIIFILESSETSLGNYHYFTIHQPLCSYISV